MHQFSCLSDLPDCQDAILNWIQDPWIDPADKEEVIALLERHQVAELRERFYGELEFGTGGLRGIVGSGTNRLNRYMVRKAIQGFSLYLLQQTSSPKVVIAYDSRLHSQMFAHEAAGVFVANGIQVFCFEGPEPTPLLSFAVRELGCSGGLCVTASHNPPQYNGLKIYGDDGAQVIPPADKQILKQVREVSSLEKVCYVDPLSSPLFLGVPGRIRDAYLGAVKQLSVRPELQDRHLPVVYTPLHGTGLKLVQLAFDAYGFTGLAPLPSQAQPDGHFPTVARPNPEEPAALTLALEAAEAQQALAVFATDPDTDRLALAIRSPRHAQGAFAHQAVGSYVLLNGNQAGALLLDHLLKNLSLQGRLESGVHQVIKTIVTTDFLTDICKKYDMSIHNTLTGFKWIAGLVRSWEQDSKRKEWKFLFGTEESFGFMPGGYVRDKDAVAALCLSAEMLAAHREQGKDLCEALLDLFADHGKAWHEELLSFDLEGVAGAQRIERIMATIRQQGFGQAEEVLDYAVPRPHTGIPPANVLQFLLKGGSKVSLRPSGTEPKLKGYVSACVPVDSCAQIAYLQAFQKAQEIKGQLLQVLEKIP